MSDVEGRKVLRARYFPDSRLRKDATGVREIRGYCRSQHSKEWWIGEMRIYSEVVSRIFSSAVQWKFVKFIWIPDRSIRE